MKNFLALAMIATLLSIFPLLTAAQIVNGSFEDVDNVPLNGFIGFAGGDSIPGWTIGGSSIEVVGNDYWMASNCVHSVDLSGGHMGSISQDVPTQTGLTYTVSFDMSGNPVVGPAVKTIVVTADGGQSTTFTYDTSVEENTLADMGYSAKAYTFVASGNSTTLTFESLTPGAYGPVIDNIAIANVTALVCHRNNGSSARKTLIVGKPAVAAHLGHGDVAGACQVPE
jgi:choice-of-anchor C domain-containing protein